MTKFTRIRFRNMTPLHIGIGRNNYDVSGSILQSDTLTAALASLRAMQGREKDLDVFLSSFALSSAFPYAGEEFFLPRMNGNLPITVRGMEEKYYRKKLKKLRFISFGKWNDLISGASLEVEEGHIHEEYLLSASQKDFRCPMRHVPVQRVSVSRNGEKDAVPFVFDWIFFRHNELETGLFCLLKANDDIKEEVISLFRELGLTGIGSDKSIGGGQFTVECDEIEIPEEKTSKVMILSTYIPSKEELEHIELPKSNYQLLNRGGFMAGSENENLRHLRRKTIYMFDTGSVFSTDAELNGLVVNLAPQWNLSIHPVFRSGRPLTIHIK